MVATVQVHSDNATKIIYVDGQSDLNYQNPLPLSEDEALAVPFATPGDDALLEIQQVRSNIALLIRGIVRCDIENVSPQPTCVLHKTYGAGCIA